MVRHSCRVWEFLLEHLILYKLASECCSLQRTAGRAELRHRLLISACSQPQLNGPQKSEKLRDGTRPSWTAHLCSHSAYTIITRKPSELGWPATSRQRQWKATPHVGPRVHG